MTPLRSSLANNNSADNIIDNNMEVDETDSPSKNSGVKKDATPFPKKSPNETPDEKKVRRKLERKRRSMFKSVKDEGDRTISTQKLRGALLKQFNKIFDKEAAFVLEVQQALPEVRNPHLHPDEDEKMENFLIEDESAKKTEAKHKKFLAKMKLMQEERDKNGTEETGRALTHEQLKERIQAKIGKLTQKANEKKRLRKQKKMEFKRQEEESTDKKKKFISKANPNLKNQHRSESGPTIKDEKLTTEIKTPLRKKPVVKSNGEIVYSKFDFISQDDPASKKIKPKAEDLLKKVQKAESKLTHLESKGRTAEAANMVESQKWGSALKRAQGEKIRDDATLLKKTIKKQDKRKQVSKKKWQERTERVDKEKAEKQDKRKANIQSRKDDRIKKVKKQQRKQGRIA